MNPTANIRSIKKQNETGRLLTTKLLYREVGQVHWEDAYTLIEVEKEGETNVSPQKLDFVSHGVEDGYGYISNLQWSIEEYVPQGTYEIILQSTCGEPRTRNDDYDLYTTQPIVGVVDYTPPKQYGSISPLYNEVLISEELVTTFTEPLNCATPFTFDVELKIGDDTYDKDNLHIVCKGRNIGLGFDPTNLSIEIQHQIMGEEFHVEIGKIGSISNSYLADRNGNVLESNVRFSKTFAAIDLRTASTVFDAEIAHSLEKEVFVVGQDSNRFNEMSITTLLQDMESRFGANSVYHVTNLRPEKYKNDGIGKFTATITIDPSPQPSLSPIPLKQSSLRIDHKKYRELFIEDEVQSENNGGNERNSIAFFYSLRDSCAAAKRRILRQDTNADIHGTSNDTFFFTSVHNMRIVPGHDDAKVLADTRKKPNILSKLLSTDIISEEDGENSIASSQAQVIQMINEGQEDEKKMAQMIKMVRKEQEEDKLAQRTATSRRFTVPRYSAKTSWHSSG